MRLRDVLAEFFHAERDRWSDQQLADKVLDLLREHGKVVHDAHGAELLLIEVDEL